MLCFTNTKICVTLLLKHYPESTEKKNYGCLCVPWYPCFIVFDSKNIQYFLCVPGGETSIQGRWGDIENIQCCCESGVWNVHMLLQHVRSRWSPMSPHPKSLYHTWCATHTIEAPATQVVRRSNAQSASTFCQALNQCLVFWWQTSWDTMRCVGKWHSL